MNENTMSKGIQKMGRWQQEETGQELIPGGSTETQRRKKKNANLRNSKKSAGN